MASRFIPNVIENLDLRPSQSPGIGRSNLAPISNRGDDSIAPIAGAFASVLNQIFNHVGYSQMSIGFEDLIRLNRRGIFLGPAESEIDFFLRAQSSIVTGAAFPLIEQQFGSVPDWIEVRTESKGLCFWEGAATWIEENSEGRKKCWIQLKDSFLTKFYPKDEVIAHETVHAMRFLFEESRFEEILAYQTSHQRFRRYFGPLFTNPNESKLFIATLGASWFVFWFNLLGTYILFVPFLLIAYAIFRLKCSQKIFSAALCNLKKATCQEPLPIALRLTDEEIEAFAESTPEKIRAFAKSEERKSLRWKQLYLSYF